MKRTFSHIDDSLDMSIAPKKTAWYHNIFGGMMSAANNDSALVNELRKLLLGPTIVKQCTEGGKVSTSELEHRLTKLKKSKCMINSSVDDLIGLCALRPGNKLSADNKTFIASLKNLTKRKCDQTEAEDRLPDNFKVLRCKDTSVCVAFGVDKIVSDRFFEYNNFEYLVKVKQIGAPSANGIIHLLTYSRDYEAVPYASTAVLKTSKTSKNATSSTKTNTVQHTPGQSSSPVKQGTIQYNTGKSYSAIKQGTIQYTQSETPPNVPDNLFYEYLVGKYFINGEIIYFPCFVETYGVYKSSKPEVVLNTVDNIQQYMEKLDPDLTDANNPNSLKNLITQTCIDNNSLSILIEAIPDAQTLQDFIVQNITPDPNNVPYTIQLAKNLHYFLAELTHILFQVYSVLSVLKNQYTHYDLHTNNVLLYKVPNDQYVTMTYKNLDGSMTSFSTKYIAKIIDYGRNYYSSGSGQDVSNSKDLYEKFVLPNPSCKGKGPYFNSPEDVGYAYFDQDSNKNNSFISARMHNNSSDLLLLKIIDTLMLAISNKVGNKAFNKAIEKWKVLSKNLTSTLVYQDPYGTPEVSVSNEKTHLPTSNVTDAYEQLKEYINNDVEKNVSDLKEAYNKNKAAGTMEIFLDKSSPLIFTPEVLQQLQDITTVSKKKIKCETDFETCKKSSNSKKSRRKCSNIKRDCLYDKTAQKQFRTKFVKHNK